MKDLRKITMVFLFFIPLTACYNPFINQRGFLTGRTDAGYEFINKQRSQNRAEVIKRTSEVYSGQRCSSEQRRHECYGSCDKIYSSRRDQKECEELTVRQIKKLQELYDVLEDADENDLADIKPDIFELYLSFSIRAFDELIDDFQRKIELQKLKTL